MPSNKNNNSARREAKVSEPPVIIKIRDFEFSIYRYINDAAPKKFRDTLVRQLLNTVGYAREAAVAGWDMAPCFFMDKYHAMNHARAKIHNTEIILNHLNDLQAISDGAKERFDIQIADIYLNLDRLLCKYSDIAQKNNCQDAEGTPTTECNH